MKRTFSSLISKLTISTVNAHYPEENMISLSELFRDSMPEYHHKLSWVFSFHGSDVCDISSKHPRDYVDALHSVMKGYRQYLPRVTVCSSVIENEIKRFFPGVSDCIIARNAVSSFKQRAAHQEFGPSLASQFKEGVPFILNVGKFTELKNQHLLLRAFDLIRDEVRHNLVLVGAHTSYFNNTLGPLIEQLGLESRVSIHKNIAPDRIGAFMGECSVFCLPSRQEGYPLVMMEAAVFGKPLVVSDNSGILECLGVDTSSIDDADAYAYVFELSESDHMSVLNLANALRMAIGVVKSEPAPLVRGINFQSTVLRERTWGKCLDAYLSASWATSLRPGGNCAGLNQVVNINDSTQDEAQ